jgi:uridine kinase
MYYKSSILSFNEAIDRIVFYLSNIQIQNLTIGIAGGSASGKTTLCKKLCEKMEIDHISMDDYYLGIDHIEDDNFDHPNSLDLSLLSTHLEKLKNGETVDKPIYDFGTHSRTGHEKFRSKGAVVVEGLYALDKKFINSLDLRIYVDAPEEIRFRRRLKRDVNERDRTPVGVKNRWSTTVQPMYEQFISKQKKYANMVVLNHRPRADNL